MSSLVGILVVAAGVLASIALHELGHLIPARRFGVHVPEYSVGFGPALARRPWRGTTVVLRAIPLGGYVRISGMFAPARPGTRVTNRRGRPTLAEQARRASSEEIPEGARAFHELPASRKAVVMLGGPAVNLLICVALVAAVLLGIGRATPSTTLQGVEDAVATASGETIPAPARQAGMRAGDTVLSWCQTDTPTWDDVRGAIAASEGAPCPVDVSRDGDPVELTVTAVRGADGGWVAGIVAGEDYAPATLAQAGEAVWELFTGTLGVIARLPQAMWDVAVSTATGAQRDPAGVMSVVGVGRLAGEITATGAAGTGAAAGGWRQTASALASLLASLNMALFVFNLIPLPPLDGGHVAGAVHEGVRRTWARLRGTPDPGPSDTARLMPLSYAVAAALMAMTVLLIVADVIDPLTLT